MDHISFLSDHNILIFLLEIGLILILAKVLSIPFKLAKLPAFPSELLAGIILGPTILGSLAPNQWLFVFPTDPVQHHMLDTVGWIGILFILLVTGMEIKVTSAWRQRTQVSIAGLVAFFIPLALALGLVWLIPESYFPIHDSPFLVRVLLAILLGVVAMPVSIRILGELGLLKTDFGIVGASSFSVADLLGWIGVTVIISNLTTGGGQWFLLIQEVVFVIAVSFFAILIGAFVLKPLPPWIQGLIKGRSGEGFGFMVIVGTFVGIITISIGVHALFGFFLAGIMLGEGKIINENARNKVEQLMESFFVPVFFAGIGLRINFAYSFDLGLFLLFSVGAIALRFIGGYLAAMLSHMPKTHHGVFGLLNTPGGELHIIAAMVAWDAHIIGSELFVAVVSGTLVSSLLAGPLSALVINNQRDQSILDLIPSAAMIHDLGSAQKALVFEELSSQASLALGMDKAIIAQSLLAREELSTTALGRGLAFPHARLPGIQRPLILPARSIEGISDWESSDGRPIHLVFLIITPQGEAGVQLAILQQLARTFSKETISQRVLHAPSEDHFYAAIRSALLETNVRKFS